MSKLPYASSVLRCHDGEDSDCKTCRFLSGDKSQEVLLAVILNLDTMLFEKERLATILTSSLAAKHTAVDPMTPRVVYGKVELNYFDSFCWNCPACKAFQYGRREDGVVFPEVVKCKDCGKQFETGASK